MKHSEHVRRFAAEQGIAEEESLKKGTHEKSEEFVEKGSFDRQEPVIFNKTRCNSVLWDLRSPFTSKFKLG